MLRLSNRISFSSNQCCRSTDGHHRNHSKSQATNSPAPPNSSPLLPEIFEEVNDCNRSAGNLPYEPYRGKLIIA